jgi:hypothetical protein
MEEKGIDGPAVGASSPIRQIDSSLKEKSAKMKHHYVPQFLLRRWANSDGKVHVLAVRDGKVVSKERAPKHTGYENGLYAVVMNVLGLGEDVIERKVFSPLDNSAAKVLEKLDRHEAIGQDEHIAWTFFLSSLRVRQPDVLDYLRHDGLKLIKQFLAERDAATLPPGAPTSEQWFAENSPGALEAASLAKLLPRMIANEALLDAFSHLKWWFREFSAAEPKLLLGDLPLQWDGGLANESFHILLPIAPDRLFVGTRSEAIEQALGQLQAAEIIRRVNLMSLASSSERLWASDKDEAKAFIDENFDMWGVDAHKFESFVQGAGDTCERN